jgi:hypothetical protein
MNAPVIKTSVTATFLLKEPNIHLDDKKNRNETIIVFRVTAGRNIDVRLSTGYKINPRYWNKAKQRVKNVAAVTNAVPINIDLDKIKNDFDRLVSQYITDRKAITKDSIKEIYHTVSISQLIAPVVEEKMKFFKFCNEIFIPTKEKKLPKTRGKKSQTVSVYKQGINHYREFQEDEMFDVDFDTIDMGFYYEFIEYMQDKTKKDGTNYSVNTIGKHIKTLCTILNEATALEYNTRLAYKSADFKIVSEITTAIYLTNDELQKMINLDLSKHPKHEKARDIFIMGSDFNRFSECIIETNDKKERYFVVNQKKTGNKVHCFITPVMKQLMDARYKGEAPSKMIEQHINKYIKEVAEMTNIEDVVVFERTEGGVKVKREIPKYSLVATHSARRSYSTNKFKAGLKPSEIMHLTGHKTEREFLKYIREDGKTQASRIVNTEAFKNSYLKVV